MKLRKALKLRRDRSHTRIVLLEEGIIAAENAEKQIRLTLDVQHQLLANLQEEEKHDDASL